MKNFDGLLKEYCSRLNDNDLYYLDSRYSQFLCGDRADISNFLSQSKDIDKMLSSAENSDEFFDMIDKIGEFVKKNVTQEIRLNFN